MHMQDKKKHDYKCSNYSFFVKLIIFASSHGLVKCCDLRHLIMYQNDGGEIQKQCGHTLLNATLPLVIIPSGQLNVT